MKRILLPLLLIAFTVSAIAQDKPNFHTNSAPVQAADTRLVLLGTAAGSGVELTRGQTASVVVVDSTPYLFDCGYGTTRALVAAGVGFENVGTIFLSHLHNDHTVDLAALFSLQWTANKTTPTEIYGPYGTAALVDAALAFSHTDEVIRVSDEGRTVRQATLFHGHDVAATAMPIPVLKDKHVTVTAVENTHFSEAAKSRRPYRSLSYRINTKERSIVFSGDTHYSKNLVELARGADVFVCEVMAQSVYDTLVARAKADAEAGKKDSRWLKLIEAHSAPADVGRMASEAGVKTVVLYHQIASVPIPGSLPASETDFIKGVRAHFSGQIIFGQDLMEL